MAGLDWLRRLAETYTESLREQKYGGDFRARDAEAARRAEAHESQERRGALTEQMTQMQIAAATRASQSAEIENAAEVMRAMGAAGPPDPSINPDDPHAQRDAVTRFRALQAEQDSERKKRKEEAEIERDTAAARSQLSRAETYAEMAKLKEEADQARADGNIAKAEQALLRMELLREQITNLRDKNERGEGDGIKYKNIDPEEIWRDAEEAVSAKKKNGAVATEHEILAEFNRRLAAARAARRSVDANTGKDPAAAPPRSATPKTKDSVSLPPCPPGVDSRFVNGALVPCR